MDSKRQEYYKEKIREGMIEKGENPDEEKVERILLDLETTAELFLDIVLEQIRQQRGAKRAAQSH